MTDLIKYDAACKAIAEAVAVDEVREIRDKATALKAYARQAKNRELEITASEIRIRAERRLGEMIKTQKATVGLNKGAAAGGKKESPRGAYTEPRDSSPTLAEAGIDKKLSSRAQKLAAVPEQNFERMLGEWRERVASENERVTENLLREGERQQRDKGLKADPPVGSYSLIYCDPPWRYEHVKTQSRAVENQYPTMTLDEIKALSPPAADDCVLFMWATSPKLAESLDVVSSWGFTYRTCAVWVKDRIGMGYYFRQRHELLLVATKGKPGTPGTDARPDSVIAGPRQDHSAKPDLVYTLLERMYPEHSKIELFARTRRDGWDAWGNEASAA